VSILGRVVRDRGRRLGITVGLAADGTKVKVNNPVLVKVGRHARDRQAEPGRPSPAFP
jgi:hypothetical protein